MFETLQSMHMSSSLLESSFNFQAMVLAVLVQTRPLQQTYVELHSRLLPQVALESFLKVGSQWNGRVAFLPPETEASMAVSSARTLTTGPNMGSPLSDRTTATMGQEEVHS